MIIENWNIQEMTGYEPLTTFYQDFSIADKFGCKAVQDTYDRAFREWKNDYKFMTELVMVLNWKLWRYYENNEELARLYNKLYLELDSYLSSHLKGDELKYYYRTID